MIINRQKFLAELLKLLTFMFEEDRASALEMYNRMFDEAENEQALLQLLVSPTRQAVVIARAYNAKAGGDEQPAFQEAIGKIRAEAMAQGIIPENAAIFEAPADEQLSIFEDEEPKVREPEKESAPAPAPAEPEEPAVPVFVSEPEEESTEPARKARPFALILFILFAVPITLALLLLLLVPTFVCLAAAGAAGGIAFVALTAALSGGFAVFADIMVVLGVALVMTALAILLLWLFVWFIGAVMVGLVSGVVSLGRKWCYKEVNAE